MGCFENTSKTTTKDEFPSVHLVSPLEDFLASLFETKTLNRSIKIRNPDIQSKNIVTTLNVDFLRYLKIASIFIAKTGKKMKPKLLSLMSCNLCWMVFTFDLDIIFIQYLKSLKSRAQNNSTLEPVFVCIEARNFFPYLHTRPFQLFDPFHVSPSTFDLVNLNFRVSIITKLVPHLSNLLCPLSCHFVQV